MYLISLLPYGINKFQLFPLKSLNKLLTLNTKSHKKSYVDSR